MTTNRLTLIVALTALAVWLWLRRGPGSRTPGIPADPNRADRERDEFMARVKAHANGA